ncbi:hypothetical protein HYT23_01230 [Candidatus Pacearchaeota archaeon]|nr:hypothetical protein [Candidatus Pacearchaeota archaeon]
MLSIEVRVNRDLIGHAYIANKKVSMANGAAYSVTYYTPNNKNKILEFEVVHKPEEGVEKLILLVYQEVVKRTMSKKEVNCL